MEAYTNFSYVYDKFMDNVPYEDWAEYIVGLLHDEGVHDGIVLDLGCGTGSITKLLFDAGYDMIGVDNSEDMLSVAIKKKSEAGIDGSVGRDILYLCQDMREFELYGTVAAIVSVCDCVNYIVDMDDLQTVFNLVWNYLDYDGQFIFDLNTPYKYRELLSDNTFAENREDASFIWENFYDEDTRINEYDLTLFVRDGEQYSKFEELHEQRAYEIDEIKSLLSNAGLELVHVYDAFTYDEPREDSERVYFVAKKNKPEGYNNE